MQTTTNQQLTINKSNHILYVVGGLLLLTSSFLALNLLCPSTTDNSYASDTTISVSHSSEDWHIDAPTSTAADAGGLSFTLDPSADGTHVAKKDVVTGGNTNVPDYQIYVSVNTADGKMPATSGDSCIAATSGTVTDATDSSSITGAAALSDNSWGFALGSFNSGINYDDLVSSSTSESWSSSKWAKLPYVSSDNLNNESTVESNAIKIYDSTSSSTNSTNVYYAVHANNDLSAGEYETKVTYTTIGLIPGDTPMSTVSNLEEASYLQEVDAAACNNSATQTYANGKTYTLKDKRTEEEYLVRKLADGRCWMVENLYLTGGTTLTPAYTDITDSTISYYADTSETTTGSYTIPESVSGTIDGQNTFSNNANNPDRTRDMNDGSKATGSYYSWSVATAGTGGTYGDGTTNQNPTDSICPKNWKLPTGGSGGEFYTLYNSSGYGSRANFITPFNFTAVGGYNNGSLEASTTVTFWLSRTGNNANNAYGMFINTVAVNPANNFGKYRGHPIRCVLPAS